MMEIDMRKGNKGERENGEGEGRAHMQSKDGSSARTQACAGPSACLWPQQEGAAAEPPAVTGKAEVVVTPQEARRALECSDPEQSHSLVYKNLASSSFWPPP